MYSSVRGQYGLFQQELQDTGWATESIISNGDCFFGMNAMPCSGSMQQQKKNQKSPTTIAAASNHSLTSCSGVQPGPPSIRLFAAAISARSVSAASRFCASLARTSPSICCMPSNMACLRNKKHNANTPPTLFSRSKEDGRERLSDMMRGGRSYCTF